MENYHYLHAKAPRSLDSMLPLEIIDEMSAMNMAFVERYGIHHLPEEWQNAQGVYILFSHLKPGYHFEAYVGQTLSRFHQRLTRHDKERPFWDTAILARRMTPGGLNSLQLNALEGKLRDILDASANVTVHNGYPTGDKTLQAGDAHLVDSITLSIMRVMFMRGYRNQHMGAEADRLYNATTATPAVPVPQPAPKASTGLTGALGRLFGTNPAPATEVPAYPAYSTAQDIPSVTPVSMPSPPPPVSEAMEELDDKGLTRTQRAKFEELRIWRRQQSINEGSGTKAFHILPDRTLVNICMAAPQTFADLLRVTGIGPDKAGKYSEAILGIMRG